MQVRARELGRSRGRFRADAELLLSSAVDANFQEIARQILRKASDIPSKKTFTAQNYMFHVQNEVRWQARPLSTTTTTCVY